MANTRLSPKTYHCTWCNQIQSGRGWIIERRRKRAGAYLNVICDKCRVFYLRGFDLEQFIAWVKEQVG